MIIFGNGQPNVSLINKEIGTLYFDKLSNSLYFKESQNSWKVLETLWNFEEFKNQLTEYLLQELSKVQYNFTLEGNKLRIQALNYDKVLEFPTILETHPTLHINNNSLNIKGTNAEEILNAIIEKLHVHKNELPKDYKYIMHVQNSSELKLEAAKAFDLIEFPNIIYTNFTPNISEEFRHFTIVPKDGYYYIEARCKVLKQETTKISMQIVVDKEKIAKTCNNPNGVSSFHLSAHCHRKLKKGDIIQVRLIASKDATVKEVELFIEAKY